MTRVFISYSRKDGSKLAELLASQLRAREVEVFFDVDSLRAGTRWESELLQRLRWATIFVVIVTPGSNESDWVYKELTVAEKLRKPVIPVQVTGSQLPVHLRGTWQSITLDEKTNMSDVVAEVLHMSLRLQHITNRLTYLKLALLAVSSILLGALLTYVYTSNERLELQASSSFLGRQADSDPAIGDLARSESLSPGILIRDTFLDGGGMGPEMVVVPPGTFDMGSPEMDPDKFENELPQVMNVEVKSFAVGRTEVSLNEFRAFVDATGYVTSAEANEFQGRVGCLVYSGSWEYRANYNWHDPAFRQADGTHPVVCVSSEDALAYIRWLSSRTGKRYRLPTEVEQEYFMRSGTRDTIYPWGNDFLPGCPYVNGQRTAPGDGGTPCVEHDDIGGGTRSSEEFLPNTFGLKHTLGNVHEISSSFYTSNHGSDASQDGDSYVLKGGSWLNAPNVLRPAFRLQFPRLERASYAGFRVVRDLD